MKKDAGAIMEFLNLPQDFDPKVFLTEAKMGEKELKKKGASKVLSILAWLETLTSQLTGPVKDNMLSEPIAAAREKHNALTDAVIEALHDLGLEEYSWPVVEL